ncbi:acyltransferase [Pseudooceanicola nitratireducens]|nr:acyltransferase [Pseudooceanicola nitratireducens]
MGNQGSCPMASVSPADWPGPAASFQTPSRAAAGRRTDIDTLRAMACIALVSYHVVGSTPSSGLELPYDHWLSMLNRTPVDLRMPLFSFISGLVFVAIPSRGAGAAVGAKARRLLLPMLCVGALFWGLRAGMGIDQQPLWSIPFLPYEHYWFLQSTFLLMALMLGLTQMLGGRDRLAAGLIGAGAAVWWLVGPRAQPDLMSLNGAIKLGPFFCGGYLAARWPLLWSWRSSALGAGDRPGAAGGGASGRQRAGGAAGRPGHDLATGHDAVDRRGRVPGPGAGAAAQPGSGAARPAVLCDLPFPRLLHRRAERALPRHLPTCHGRGALAALPGPGAGGTGPGGADGRRAPAVGAAVPGRPAAARGRAGDRRFGAGSCGIEPVAEPETPPERCANSLARFRGEPPGRCLRRSAHGNLDRAVAWIARPWRGGYARARSAAPGADTPGQCAGRAADRDPRGLDHGGGL